MPLSVQDAIRTRRTGKRSLATPIEIDLVYDLLEQASYAPFHKKEPWLAKIITTTSEKDFLYEKIIGTYRGIGLFHDSESENKYTTKMTRLILNAQVTILFAREVIPDNKRLDSDAIQATAALIQNFSLLAWEQDLAGFWASSPFVMDAILAKELGFPDHYELIANYRLGYRDHQRPTKEAKRQPVKAWASPLL